MTTMPNKGLSNYIRSKSVMHRIKLLISTFVLMLIIVGCSSSGVDKSGIFGGDDPLVPEKYLNDHRLTESFLRGYVYGVEKHFNVFAFGIYEIEHLAFIDIDLENAFYDGVDCGNKYAQSISSHYKKTIEDIMELLSEKNENELNNGS